MDLILWRHAEAFDAREGQSDLERALTTKGQRQAERMAVWLARHLPADARVLVSPALRAQQTAAALHRGITTLPALAPGATAQAVLHASQWPDAREPVLVVGHQPTLGLVAAQLLARQGESLALRKGAVWWLRASGRAGALHVVLHAAMSPDML